MSRTIYNTADVVAAFQVAQDAGKPLTDVMSIDWSSPRAGPNGTKYVSVYFSVGNRGRAVFRYNGEKHVGQIAPLDDDEVARLNSDSPNRAPLKKRDRHACLQFQRWSCQVGTEEDGITIKKDEESNETILPDDEKLSPVFALVAFMDEVFSAETKRLIANGTICGRDPKKGLSDYPKGTIVASNLKVVSMVQWAISMDAKRNAGELLPNPMMRIRMKCDKDTGMPKAKFYDKSKGFSSGGRKKFETLQDEDSVPLNAHNIHNLVPPRSLHDGIANAGSVCFSNMGISLPIDVEVDVVEQPASYEVDVDDVYGNEDDENPSTPLQITNPVAKTTPPARLEILGPPAVTRGAAPAPAVNEEALDDLVGELSGMTAKGQ